MEFGFYSDARSRTEQYHSASCICCAPPLSLTFQHIHLSKSCRKWRMHIIPHHNLRRQCFKIRRMATYLNCSAIRLRSIGRSAIQIIVVSCKKYRHWIFHATGKEVQYVKFAKRNVKRAEKERLGTLNATLSYLIIIFIDSLVRCLCKRSIIDGFVNLIIFVAENLLEIACNQLYISPGWFLNKSSAVAEMGDRLATIDMGRKLGGAVSLMGGAGSPSNTMWPMPRPTSLLSFILIRPTVWPQYANITDRQTGQNRRGQRSDSIQANRFTNGRPIKLIRHIRLVGLVTHRT